MKKALMVLDLNFWLSFFFKNPGRSLMSLYRLSSWKIRFWTNWNIFVNMLFLYLIYVQVELLDRNFFHSLSRPFAFRSFVSRPYSDFCLFCYASRFKIIFAESVLTYLKHLFALTYDFYLLDEKLSLWNILYC